MLYLIMTWKMNLIWKMSNKETFKQKINKLSKLSGWDKDKSKEFISMVAEYLDACGYFICDFDGSCLEKYTDKDFGTWLLDMALQYNMEQGKQYLVTLCPNEKNSEN